MFNLDTDPYAIKLDQGIVVDLSETLDVMV